MWNVHRLVLAALAAPGALAAALRTADNATDLTLLSIREAAAQIQEGSLLSTQLVEAYLARIDAVDEQLRSFIYVAHDEALAAAAQVDKDIAAGQYRGPLHGIPFGIKDLYFSGSIPTTGNSRLDWGNLTEQVSTVITNLEAAGAILIGKMDTGEFASGTVKLYMDLPHDLAANPWDLDRFAGGSSTGPGAGVGGRTTLLAVGGDTGGSIRLPSAACGVQGLKPTFGRVSNYGAISNTWSRDCAGPIGWNVEDLGYALEAMGGFDIKDSTTVKTTPFKFDPTIPQDLSGRRVGVVNISSTDYEELQPAMRAGIENVIDLLRDNGAEIVPTNLPSRLAEYGTVGSPISNVEFHVSNWDLIMSDPAAVGQGTRDRLSRILGTTAIDYGEARKRALEMTSELEDLFQDFEVLVLPGTFYTAGLFSEPKEISDFMLKTAMVPASITGHPALSMRAGFDGELPLNFQMIAPLFDEAALIRYGMFLEPLIDGDGPRRVPKVLG
jgi:aspartyl-tRNA(Asn)/glutamyl-tRNA(Gln) amidotransferase subunit A